MVVEFLTDQHNKNFKLIISINISFDFVEEYVCDQASRLFTSRHNQLLSYANIFAFYSFCHENSFDL